MRKQEVDACLGRRVNVRLFDGSEYEGTLHATGEEQFKGNPNLYLPKRYYFLSEGMACISAIFCCSHVKKMEVVKDGPV